MSHYFAEITNDRSILDVEERLTTSVKRQDRGEMSGGEGGIELGHQTTMPLEEDLSLRGTMT